AGVGVRPGLCGPFGYAEELQVVMGKTQAGTGGQAPSAAGSGRSAASTRSTSEIFQLCRTPGEAHPDAQKNRMAASTRLHPIAAIRAIRHLWRDREDTRQVFLLMDALRGKTTLRQF